MDLTNPIARSAVVHWEHKTARFTFFRFFLTLILIFQSTLTPALSVYVPNSRVITWIASWVFIGLILVTFTMVEWVLFSDKQVATDRERYTSNNEEIRVRTIITILIACLHAYHQTGVRSVLTNMLRAGRCPACVQDTIGAGLIDIGRSYIEELLATILSIATLWCISPCTAFLRSRKLACFWMIIKYAIWVVLMVTLTAATWTLYCTGEEMCYGNMAVAAWALIWVPVGRQLSHLAPFLNLAGKEVIREYPNRHQWYICSPI